MYLLASKRNRTLYKGVTSKLKSRVLEPKNNFAEGFTSRYNVNTLVWYELHDTMESAIRREKAIKNRQRLVNLPAAGRTRPGRAELWGMHLSANLAWPVQCVPYDSRQNSTRCDDLTDADRR